MRRTIMLVALLVLTASWALGACSINDFCTIHGVNATFTGRTRNSGGKIYGQYAHGNCTHWALCD